MLTTLAVSNYRSLRNLVVPLRSLNLVTGPNGCGKSSLYRALRLLAATAQGAVIPSLAREGGLPSTLWAGPESLSRSVLAGQHPVEGTVRKHVVSLRMGFASDSDGFGYLIDLGLPPPSTSAFKLDPQIKQECLWHGSLRPSTMLADRAGPIVRVRSAEGVWTVVLQSLPVFESMMTQLADPQNAPEMLLLREAIRAWRFYDHIRTDADAPARISRIGTLTPILDDDGADLAAALQTIREIGDVEALDAAIEDAFPGSQVSVVVTDGRFALAMRQHGLLRPLQAAELSDGTLRYLLWIAALLTPRPPELMVLNEPETSLHPDLLAPLARLLSQAARRSQIVVVSHSAPLIAALKENPECHSLRLEKSFGETRLADAEDLDIPRWHWPGR